MSPRPPVETLPLHDAWASLSLIDYLCLLWPDRARRTVRDLFAKGLLRQANRPVSPRCRVADLSELTLHVPAGEVPRMFPTAAADQGPAPLILHEDERLVVLSKPAGLSVIPDRDEERGSCLEFLTRRELRGRSSRAPCDYRRLRIVHRIDRWTSGLVLVAKTASAERQLALDFEARRVRKEYLAIVSGAVAAARTIVDCPIGVGRKGKLRAVARGDAGGKEARTTFDVMERLGELTLVRARPETGRQHQIRVHAWVMGHPLAVDPLYSVGPHAYGRPLEAIERLTLHAYRYSLSEHWSEPRSFCCPLPEDFRTAVDVLRKA